MKTIEKMNFNELANNNLDVTLSLAEMEKDFQEHFHDYIEIVYLQKGKQTHFVNNNKINLNEGNVLLIKPYSMHSTKKADNSIAINLIISDKMLNSLVKDSNYNYKFTRFQKYLIADSESYYEIDSIASPLDELVEFIDKEDILSSMRLRAIAYRTLIELVSAYNVSHKPKISHKNINLDLIDYLKNNIKTASLKEYAHQFYISESRLSLIIKENYNANFKDILRELRLAKAADLLINTSKNIELIMEEIGYNNKTFFYEIFKKKYGTTPSKFRKYK